MNREEKLKIEEMAYFAEETYKKQNNKETIVDIIGEKYPDMGIDIIYALVYAIDAYVDINVG